MFVKYGLLYSNDDIFISNNMTFSNIRALNLINGSINHKVNLIDDVYINITNVKVAEKLFSLKNRPVLLYPLCYFQYHSTLHSYRTISQKIVIVSKSTNKIFDTSTANINCRFQQNTGLNPLKVYLKYIETEHKDALFDTGFLCYCHRM